MRVTLRRILLPGLAAAAVLALGQLAAARWQRPGTWLYARMSAFDRSFSERWSLASATDERPALIVAGSSLSRAEGPVTLASELERVLVARVRNEAGDGHYLADEWAALLARRMPVARLHLVELNPWFFEEREFLYFARPEDELVRRAENALSLLACVSPRLALALLQQPGLHALIAGGVRRCFAPYDLGQSLHESVRKALRAWLLTPLDPQAVPAELQASPERVRELVARNFGRKTYAGDRDARVLADLLQWSGARPDPAAYVLYVPPLHLELIEEAAGAPARERLERWIESVRAACAGHGVPCIDLSGLFRGREQLFLDYGHLRERAFRELAERLAESLAPLLRERG